MTHSNSDDRRRAGKIRLQMENIYFNHVIKHTVATPT